MEGLMSPSVQPNPTTAPVLVVPSRSDGPTARPVSEPHDVESGGKVDPIDQQRVLLKLQKLKADQEFRHRVAMREAKIINADDLSSRDTANRVGHAVGDTRRRAAMTIDKVLNSFDLFETVDAAGTFRPTPQMFGPRDNVTEEGKREFPVLFSNLREKAIENHGMTLLKGIVALRGGDSQIGANVDQNRFDAELKWRGKHQIPPSFAESVFHRKEPLFGSDKDLALAPLIRDTIMADMDADLRALHPASRLPYGNLPLSIYLAKVVQSEESEFDNRKVLAIAELNEIANTRRWANPDPGVSETIKKAGKTNLMEFVCSSDMGDAVYRRVMNMRRHIHLATGFREYEDWTRTIHQAKVGLSGDPTAEIEFARLWLPFLRRDYLKLRKSKPTTKETIDQQKLEDRKTRKRRQQQAAEFLDLHRRGYLGIAKAAGKPTPFKKKETHKQAFSFLAHLAD